LPFNSSAFWQVRFDAGMTILLDVSGHDGAG
jgi:hypothetical protein